MRNKFTGKSNMGKCNLREKLVGDGRDVCNPTKALKHFKYAISELDSCLREIGTWIPVTDRLPESGEPVLVVCGAEILCATHTQDGWLGRNIYNILYCSLETAPTHWMSLPDIPRET
jgi:hypothetical protein